MKSLGMICHIYNVKQDLQPLHTVVHPGTVMVHLFNASLADRAMVGPLRFYTAALRTFEYYLTLLKAHELNILFGRISPRHSTWVRQHCPDMGAQGEKCQGLKNNAVHYCKYFIRVGVEDHS